MKNPVCPMGFDCADRNCPNRNSCRDLTYSWEIPYYVKDGALIVKTWGWRYDWRDEDQGLGWNTPRRCSLPSGDYRPLDYDEHDYELKQRLRQAWFEAGWMAAVPLSLNKEILELEFDEIPF